MNTRPDAFRFSISDIQPSVNTRGIIAKFQIRLSCCTMPANLVRRQDGSEFVCGLSVRDSFAPGGWNVLVRLEPEFAAEVLREVRSQMQGQQPPTGVALVERAP